MVQTQREALDYLNGRYSRDYSRIEDINDAVSTVYLADPLSDTDHRAAERIYGTVFSKITAIQVLGPGAGLDETLPLWDALNRALDELTS
ncbi:MAG: hypothetical protein ACLPQY_27140 [Streptosporangiaceae bacterium]